MANKKAFQVSRRAFLCHKWCPLSVSVPSVNDVSTQIGSLGRLAQNPKEMRFGPNNRFRVFYRTDPSIGEVHILAIGVKVGNRLFIGGEEFEL